MENENTEQITADQEAPQPKKMSAKECVQRRLSGLASGAIQPVKRGPGRPRGPNYGKGHQSRMDPNNPLSVARAEAGRKGQATIQSRVQKEAWRKRNGRVLQAVLDQEIAALKEEVKTYKYAEKTFDQKDTSEFVDYCRVILEDCIWNRKCPIERDNFYDELENQVPQEERQFCSWWPEIAVTDVLIMARYVMAPDRPGLQKLALKTVESFIDWSKNQTASDLEKRSNQSQVHATETTEWFDLSGTGLRRSPVRTSSASKDFGAASSRATSLVTSRPGPDQRN